MDEEALNKSIRAFLKKVGITSQREFEKQVREAVAAGKLQDSDEIPVSASISSSLTAEPLVIEGKLRLSKTHE